MTEPHSQRIVSLLPSATEIVAALGCADRLVGRSHECDFPADIAGLPIVSRPRIDIDASSAEIDRQVKAAEQNALSVYDVDTTLLAKLRPDVIVTQDLCAVCAVSLSDVEQAVCDLTGAPVDLVSCRPGKLADIWTDIRRVAKALGAVRQGNRLIERLTLAIEGIESQCRLIEPKPTVACVEWLDPLMAAGNWVPELIARAGGVSLFGQAGKHSPWLTFEALATADPDVIVVSACGFDIERSLKELPALTEQPGWRDMRAVRDGRVYVTDGHQFFNRPGPRIVETLEILAEILHPGRFAFGHEGGGWIKP